MSEEAKSVGSPEDGSPEEDAMCSASEVTADILLKNCKKTNLNSWRIPSPDEINALAVRVDQDLDMLIEHGKAVGLAITHSGNLKRKQVSSSLLLSGC